MCADAVECYLIHQTDTVLIAREIVPIIQTREDKLRLVCIGIGTHERSKEFAGHVGFPDKYLYADPNNAVYDALELIKSSPTQLFFDTRTPLSLGKRIKKGKTDDLRAALANWKPWIPPKLDQGFQQGGAFVFDGETTLFGRKDPATGDHADLNELIQIALSTSEYR